MKNWLYAVLTLATIGWMPAANAAFLLPGGDFESGDFFGWTASDSLGGFSQIVFEGECFSANDTTGITLFGSAAAMLRSNQQGQVESGASITSELFTAGSAISFAALSEVPFGQNSDNPVSLTVSLLDADNNVVLSHRIERTGSAVLSPGCGASPANGAFTGHLIDTNLFEGQQIRVRFEQNTNREGFGLFTLIDDVFVFEPGEVPILIAPLARAGTRIENGELQLDASATTHPMDIAMTYEWFIDGVSGSFEGEQVSIADLASGNYMVVLFAHDGLSVSTDVMLLGIPDTSTTTTTDTTGTTTDTTTTGTTTDTTDTTTTGTTGTTTTTTTTGTGTTIDMTAINNDDSSDNSDSSDDSDSSGSSSDEGNVQFNAGFAQGFSEGFSEGTQSSEDSFQTGFDSGYDTGFNQGYDQGYDDGVFDCDNMLNGQCP